MGSLSLGDRDGKVRKGGAEDKDFVRSVRARSRCAWLLSHR